MENIDVIKTISNEVTSELIEKKSKFIANIKHVETVEEAEEYISLIKKKYHDAKHNVFAYAIEGEAGALAIKYNEDGEPQGTAGSPILKIILEKGLSNIVVVVTRYFGGILLGTGGLVRAYSGVVIDAISKANIVEKKKGYKVKLLVEYEELDKLKYNANKCNFKIVNIEYLENVELLLEILEEDIDKITNSNNNNLFKILKYDILEEKFIDI